MACKDEGLQFITSSSSSAPPTAKDNELQSNLSSIGLKQCDIDFILDQGENFLDKPVILSKKLKVSQEKAKVIISALKNTNKNQLILLAVTILKI